VRLTLFTRVLRFCSLPSSLRVTIGLRCGSCHSLSLQGRPGGEAFAPAFLEQPFSRRWSRPFQRCVSRLFFLGGLGFWHAPLVDFSSFSAGNPMALFAQTIALVESPD